MYPSAFERTRSDELFDGSCRSGSLARYARAPPAAAASITIVFVVARLRAAAGTVVVVDVRRGPQLGRRGRRGVVGFSRASLSAAFVSLVVYVHFDF